MPDELRLTIQILLKGKLKTRLKEINNLKLEKEAILINNKKSFSSITRLFLIS